MTHMTPEWARDRLNTIESRRMVYPASTLIALEALAADTLEYKVETLYNGHWREPSVYADYYWLDDYDWAVESIAAWQKEYPDEKFRIVARRVSPEWVVTE